MKRLWKGCLGLALGFPILAQQANGQEMQWRPVATPATAPSSFGITLRAPQPEPGTDASALSVIQRASTTQANDDMNPIVRAQVLEPSPAPFAPGPASVPPPPPFPAGGPLAGTPDTEKYSCAVTAKREGNFWDQCRDGFTGIFSGGGSDSRSLFQSDHRFDNFISPVSNPFFFEDPRALTEVKPLVVFQQVPGSNYALLGGNLWFYGVQGRLAVTDWFSVVVNKLGGVTLEPSGNSKVGNDSGFAEVSLGPKFTFLTLDSTKTVVAAGINFDLAIGSSGVFQNTGDLSLIPYISVAQSLGKYSFGSFNFMNTTGYSFSTDNDRTDFVYSSFHFDYDVLNLNKIFPLIELNYFHYTRNGGDGQFFGFEGRNLINFGSGGVAGHNDLSLAFGLRYKFAEWCQAGFAVEYPLIKPSDIMDYRLTFDLIFRY